MNTKSAAASDDAATTIISQPKRFITRMGLFLAVVLLVCLSLIGAIAENFMANPALNGLIFGTLLIGILYAFRQVFLLRSEANWLAAFQREQNGALAGADTEAEHSPILLAPMATMLRARGRTQTLSALSTRSILDSVASRLDEARDISRYMTGLLIFLGLLGTFWGLLQTIGAVGDTIGNLTAGSGDVAAIFEDLKAGLAAPLDGMGTAFSSSLFGLAGSLVLGFLDLQVGGAQNRFFNELEEWLSERTRLTSGGGIGEGEGGGSVPAYVSALLEQTADGLENLQRTLARTEERRMQADQTMMRLGEQFALLAEKMAEPAPPAPTGMDDATRRHMASIDAHLARLIEEQAQGRSDALADLRADIRLLTRTIAQAAERSNTGKGA